MMRKGKTLLGIVNKLFVFKSLMKLITVRSAMRKCVTSYIKMIERKE